MSLTNKEIFALAPAAAARTPAGHCSKLYRFIPTMDVVDALRENGYVPVEAKQDRTVVNRFNEHLHARHAIRLRLSGTEALDMKRTIALGGLVPEILLYNSSNGGSGIQLRRGFYRQVCSNGMIAMVMEDAIGMQHRNFETAADVIQRVQAMSKSSKPLFERIAQWSKLRLDPKAQARYAFEALMLRLGDDEQRARRYDAMSMLTVRREADEAPTLWNLFNRAQENGMRHGAVALESEASRAGLAMRPIKSIAADEKWNTGLWALTERWAAKA